MKGLKMAELTKEQVEKSSAEMQSLIFQHKITRAEWNKLDRYESDKAVVGGMYRLTSVAAIKKLGPTLFELYDVIG